MSRLRGSVLGMSSSFAGTHEKACCVSWCQPDRLWLNVGQIAWEGCCGMFRQRRKLDYLIVTGGQFEGGARAAPRRTGDAPKCRGITMRYADCREVLGPRPCAKRWQAETGQRRPIIHSGAAQKLLKNERFAKLSLSRWLWGYLWISRGASIFCG